MGWFDAVDWEAMFVPDTPLLETFLRGSLIYLGLFCLLRLVLKRQSGTVGISDMLVIVLIADAAQNGMADDYKSIPDGLLLVGTIIFWDFALNWLGYHVPFIHRFVHPSPILLIKEGKMLRHNMRQELITKDELLAQLREQGVESVQDVRKAFLEGDGHLSVISYDEKQRPERKEFTF